MSTLLSRAVRPATLMLLVGVASGVAAGGCNNDNPKLTVTAIEPDHGDAEGGSFVRIRGTRFTSDGPRSVKVFFGGFQGRVSRFESDNVLIVEAPGGKPNDVVDVLIVFDPGGQIKIPKAFHFAEHKTGAPTVDDLTGTGSAKK
jgi:hypothetical protein